MHVPRGPAPPADKSAHCPLILGLAEQSEDGTGPRLTPITGLDLTRAPPQSPKRLLQSEQARFPRRLPLPAPPAGRGRLSGRLRLAHAWRERNKRGSAPDAGALGVASRSRASAGVFPRGRQTPARGGQGLRWEGLRTAPSRAGAVTGGPARPRRACSGSRWPWPR